MDFIDEVRTRSGRFAKRVPHLDTEEATKSSLVLPFIQMLGYEIFDPTEVVPEFTADVGIKKGEKVDYALIQNGKPVILFECKRHGSNLDEAEFSQLLRYFTVTEARFGVLTDGITYRFFSDLDEPNVLDSKPFFEFNMMDFTEEQVQELKRFTKSAFDMSEIVDAARDLKYTTEIKRLLAEELDTPSDEFVRFIIGKVYPGRATTLVRQMFEALTHQALTQFVNERIDDRLKSALKRDEDREAKPVEPKTLDDEPEFVPAEIEALYAFKSITRGLVDPARLQLQNTKHYCNVRLANEPEGRVTMVIGRLWLRTESKEMNLQDGAGRQPLESLDSIYEHAEAIRARVETLVEPGHREETG